MRIIKLTGSYGTAFYVVAAHVVAFWRLSDEFLKSRNIDAHLTAVLLTGSGDDTEGSFWVTESPEDIARLLPEEEYRDLPRAERQRRPSPRRQNREPASDR